ncbi:hypothetical protein R3P38DRAFT_3229189 [Favolaschia claudopus]|uniref:Uncharacterized protein n=1 Tax=Favolaschia claudopus TaxID=2862362 RepID=A0AAV9ZPB6_9AGAR
MGSDELPTLFIKVPSPGHGSSPPVQPACLIILNEQQLQNLKVTEIEASLATFRACWRTGMTVMNAQFHNHSCLHVIHPTK